MQISAQNSKKRLIQKIEIELGNRFNRKIFTEDNISKWSQAYWLSDFRVPRYRGRVIPTRGPDIKRRQDRPKFVVFVAFLLLIWARADGFRVSGDDATQDFQWFNQFPTPGQKNRFMGPMISDLKLVRKKWSHSRSGHFAKNLSIISYHQSMWVERFCFHFQNRVRCTKFSVWAEKLAKIWFVLEILVSILKSFYQGYFFLGGYE